MPDYQDEFVELLDDVTARLSDLGIGSEQTVAIIDSFDLGQLAGIVTSALAGMASIVTNLAFVVTLVLFVCIDAGSFGQHLQDIRGNRSAIVEALESFASGTRTYLLVSTAFGLVVAVIDTVMLYLLDVPGALLWDLLAFITNYIPNIGFILGLVPPAVLGLLEGWARVDAHGDRRLQPRQRGDPVGDPAQDGG